MIPLGLYFVISKRKVSLCLLQEHFSIKSVFMSVVFTLWCFLHHDSSKFLTLKAILTIYEKVNWSPSLGICNLYLLANNVKNLLGTFTAYYMFFKMRVFLREQKVWFFSPPSLLPIVLMQTDYWITCQRLFNKVHLLLEGV